MGQAMYAPGLRLFGDDEITHISHIGQPTSGLNLDLHGFVRRKCRQQCSVFDLSDGGSWIKHKTPFDIGGTAWSVLHWRIHFYIGQLVINMNPLYRSRCRRTINRTNHKL